MLLSFSPSCLIIAYTPIKASVLRSRFPCPTHQLPCGQLLHAQEIERVNAGVSMLIQLLPTWSPPDALDSNSQLIHYSSHQSLAMLAGADRTCNPKHLEGTRLPRALSIDFVACVSSNYMLARNGGCSNRNSRYSCRQHF